MAEGGALVEGHLGVQGVDPAVGGQDQRVDLHQLCIALDEAAVELHQQLDGALARLPVQPRPAHQAGRGLGREPLDGIDVLPGDRLRLLGRHLLDVDPTPARHHAQVQLRRTVEREAGVVLPGDVRRVLDPQPAHDVALDVHPEDGPGVAPDLGGVARQLDAAGLASTAHLDLCLHHDGVSGPVGLGDGLVGRVGHATRRHRDPVAGEVLLALVLEQVHLAASLVSSRSGCSRLRPPAGRARRPATRRWRAAAHRG